MMLWLAFWFSLLAYLLAAAAFWKASSADERSRETELRQYRLEDQMKRRAVVVELKKRL